ncbi:hypothetical protein GCM10010104_21880 [Streptomyces indiaensis]|uniref:acetyl-CoA C-acetyltransferase n=1 Tax=Streptomyces indiaensis TaxID=284033 RepID=A0ABP5Q899_9ACTN|nr:hypothetical protein [Streptomyces indiaensis]
MAALLAGLPVAEWPALDPAILDPQGGAIALRHPLEASGARLAGTVAHELVRRGGGVGVAACASGWGKGSPSFWSAERCARLRAVRGRSRSSPRPRRSTTLKNLQGLS